MEQNDIYNFYFLFIAILLSVFRGSRTKNTKKEQLSSELATTFCKINRDRLITQYRCVTLVDLIEAAAVFANLVSYQSISPRLNSVVLSPRQFLPCYYYYILRTLYYVYTWYPVMYFVLRITLPTWHLRTIIV